MSNVEATRKGFTRKERKRMGVTWWNVVRILRDMKAANELSPDNSLNALTVMERLAADRPEAFVFAEAERDWDSFLEFLEKLIALLMKILPFFI